MTQALTRHAEHETSPWPLLTGMGVLLSALSRVAWLLGGLIPLSFAFGVVMFLPAENRAQKLEQMQKKYQAKRKKMPSSSAYITAQNH